jgi:glycosyltransferase involved in cell wall biosynthesis
VITLGDVWVLDPNVLKAMPSAHWLPSDCRPMSTADKNVVEAGQSELIAMSRFGEARFRDAGFDPVYVPHAIDTELFQPGDKTAVRAMLGLKDNDFVIGVNAANSDAIRKAAPEMMIAFAKFHADHPEAVLALHTGVHQEGGQNLEVVAENLGITDRVRCVDQYRYHGGMVSPQEMADWYNGLDVLAGCTYGEGFGIPLIEAQACGVPVITTDASAMTELNPYGVSITGEPFYNGVHQAWWVRPSISQMLGAFNHAYDTRDSVNREQLREFAQQYDVNVVAKKFMVPALDVLLERMQSR